MKLSQLPALMWPNLEVGLRLICIEDSYRSHTDIYGHVGTIREIDKERTRFFITWDEERFNLTNRGRNSWSVPHIFAAFTPEVEDLKRRQQHADKYL